ncbi:MAG: hypothetical protein AB2A00_36060 [Myxococcota bacterium]
MGAPTVFSNLSNGVICHAGAVAVSLWTSPLTSESVRELRRGMQTQHAAHPSGIYSLGIYRFTTLGGGFDEGVRQEIAQLLAETRSCVRAGAVVIDSPGLVAAAIRMAFSGVLLLARSSAPMKAFSTVDDALAWLSAREGFPTGGAAGARLAITLAERTHTARAA